VGAGSHVSAKSASRAMIWQSQKGHTPCHHIAQAQRARRAHRGRGELRGERREGRGERGGGSTPQLGEAHSDDSGTCGASCGGQ